MKNICRENPKSNPGRDSNWFGPHESAGSLIPVMVDEKDEVLGNGQVHACKRCSCLYLELSDDKAAV